METLATDVLKTKKRKTRKWQIISLITAILFVVETILISL